MVKVMREILKFDSKPIVTGEIELIEKENGYLLKVGKEGGRVKLVGEKGKVGGAVWSEDKYFVIPLRYDTYHTYYFQYRFFAEDGTCVQSDFATMPFMDVDVSFPLTFLNLETVFMPRTPGRLKNMMHGRPQKAKDIVAIELFVPKSSYECEIFYGLPYLSDVEEKYVLDVEPQLDEFGQWTMKDFKGKIHSEQELFDYLNEARSGELPVFSDQISQYGGNLSMKREATGYFRLHKEDGVWWFCDPEGYLFYSQGMDVVGAGAFSPTTGIENLFAKLPPQDGVYANAWNNGYQPAWNFSESVSMLSANLIRVFGEEWLDAWKEITAKRLRYLGYNTVANFSRPKFGMEMKIPYITQGDFPETKETLFRSMPDVFSNEYKESAKECAKWLLEYKDDKFMVGYFMRNEPDWAFGTYNIAGIMLEKDVNFATKDVFIAEMIRKYFTIEEFNKAWNLNLSSFAEIKKPMEKPWLLSETAKEDLENFTRRIIREYIRVPAEAYRQVDHNHLNLGLRWGWLENEDLLEGCEYCDAFSINCYKEAPEKDLFDRIHAMTNLPIVIGEFQVGALDVGNLSNGMFGVEDQRGRGEFYQYYMETAASYPYMLGAHYFGWNDQPVLGTANGENLNIGVNSVVYKPYEDFAEGIINTHRRMMDVHSGKTPPTSKRSKLVPKEGF